MRAVLGIGNPGRQYENTRHNIGFGILDKFADKHKISFYPSKKDYLIAGSELNAAVFFLIKPVTFVNLSGIAASDFLSEHNIDLQDFLVVHDDINLDPGRIKIKQSGGDGGHNGINSIIYHLQNDSFPRLRFGIGKDFQQGQMADYVLSRFPKSESAILETQIGFAVDLIENFIAGGLKDMLKHYSVSIKNQINSTDKNEV